MVFTYSKYDFKVSNLFIDGYFSKYDETSNIFTLSDGDTIAFDLETEQKFVTIETLRADTAACSDKVTVTVGNNNKTITIKNKDNTDYTSDVYKITEWQKPYINAYDSSSGTLVSCTDKTAWKISAYGGGGVDSARFVIFYKGEPWAIINDDKSVVTPYTGSKQVTSNQVMYFSEADFKKNPYFYQAKEISRYQADLLHPHAYMQEGIITANSNASLTNSEGKKYKAPASSGVLSEPKPIGSAQVGLTITTSSGKTISRTIYISVEKRYCSRNDNDLVE